MPMKKPSGLKSVQRGTLVINAYATSATATISAVNTAKAVVKYNGQIVNNGGNGSAHCARLWLNSSTQIGAVRIPMDTGTTQVNYEVLDFY